MTEISEPRYPGILVEEPTGYAKSLVLAGRVQGALRHAGVPQRIIAQFNKQYKGTWKKRLAVARKWVTVTVRGNGELMCGRGRPHGCGLL